VRRIARLAFLLLVAWSCTAPAEDARALHLLCWSEYVPQLVIDGFEKQSHARVAMETYNSNEQMLAKLRAKPGYYDLIQPSGFYVATLIKQGELAPLDFARIPNLRNIDPMFSHLAFDPEAKYSVPWLAGTVGMVVNTERVKDPIQDYADVFSGQYSGRIVVVDDAREMVAWALASLDLPITEVGAASLVRIEPVLAKWLPQVAIFDSDNPSRALLDGRADLGIVWSGEAAVLWAKDHKFAYVLPKRGAHRFVDSLAVPQAAPHKALAEDFINHCLEPDVSVLISEAYPYTNPNLAARRLLKPEQLANPASYPPGELKLPMLHNEGNTTAAVAAFVQGIRERLKPRPR
jgi:spermidine/putrescine transport system substrate-binding protein